jgi:nucleoside-diphosphate-sugar epimerase
MNMKIAVIGGTGLIGSRVVKILNASGHCRTRRPPARTCSVGRACPNSPTFNDASPAFFQTTMDNLLTAARPAASMLADQGARDGDS